MTANDARKLTPETARAKLDELREGRTDFAKDFNARFSKATNSPNLFGGTDATVELFNALRTAAFPPNEQQRPAQQPNRASDDIRNEAKFEIGNLSADKEFWTRFKDGGHIGHKHAVQTWTRLHDLAFGGDEPQRPIELAASGSPVPR